MNKAAVVLLLAFCAAFLTEGCGASRKARKERKLEQARRADSVAAAAQRQAALPINRTDSAAVVADTVETAALDPSKTSAPPFLLSLHGSSVPFRSFSGKAKMRYENGEKSQEFSSSFRIRRDSAIWISVVALGGVVPVARVLITPDSVLAVNYLQREAYRMPIADVTRLLPMPTSFSALQNLLLGNVLQPEAPIVSTGKTETADVYYVATASGDTRYTAYYRMADTTLLSESSSLRAGEVETNVLYRRYEAAAGRKFATDREVIIRVRGADGSQEHRLFMQFNDPPRFDGPLEFSFSVPRNYSLK